MCGAVTAAFGGGREYEQEQEYGAGFYCGLKFVQSVMRGRTGRLVKLFAPTGARNRKKGFVVFFECEAAQAAGRKNAFLAAGISRFDVISAGAAG